ncbi:MAG: hypothetical protein JXR16_01245 [Bermanella sp.]
MNIILTILILFLSLSANAYDPMAPPGYGGNNSNVIRNNKKIKAVEEKGDFKLLQIVINSKTKNATIDGRIVNEGDYLKNAYVKSISKETVVLVLSDKEMILTLTNEYPRIRHSHEAYGM